MAQSSLGCERVTKPSLMGLCSRASAHAVSTASLGLGLMAIAASELAREGVVLPEIIRRLELMKRDQGLIFTLGSIDYLVKGGRVGNFDLDLVREFFQGLTNHLRANLHVQVEYGQNPHHMVEAVYKALGRALDQATGLDPRLSGVVPSTKGSLA